MYYIDASKMKEKKGVIIDCRFDMNQPQDGYKAYLEGHIEGAHYVDLDKDMTGPKREHGGRHPLADLEEFTRKIAAMGVEAHVPVYLYDDGTLAMACRLWFMLKLIGLNDIYIIRGGYKALLEAGYTEEKTLPAASKSDLALDYQGHLICGIDEVKESLQLDSHILVDARAGQRYLGLEEPIDFVAGHIPGSHNYFWQETLVDNFDANMHFKDLKTFDQVINQCGSGVTGCVNMFFMAEAGIASKLYLGSFSDWISYDENEIVVKNNQLMKVKQVKDEGEKA